MMKRLLPFLVFILLGQGLWSQITVDNSVFPQIGDTLVTVYDGVPTGVSIGSAGPNQSWSFSKLQGLMKKSIYASPGEGKSKAFFPGADMLRKDNGNRELYINATNAKLEYMGFAEADLIGIDVATLTKFTPALEELQVPLNYQDKKTSNAKTVLVFGAESLPGYLLDSLPISPDSVRLRIEIQRKDEIDAWGVLSIPGGDYEVLRKKRTEVRNTFIDAKISSLPWLDMTDAVDKDLAIIGKEISTHYYFISEEEKEPIAILEVDPKTKIVQKVEYKANDVKSNINYVNKGRVDVFAYPNPAIEEVRFEFLNLPKGNYELSIYNILGVEVLKEEYKINTNRTARVDLTEFRKGTYLYSLVNEKGKTITTKRLIILRP